MDMIPKTLVLFVLLWVGGCSLDTSRHPTHTMAVPGGPAAAEAERALALAATGDAGRGQLAYAVCGACHQPSGRGRPDGEVPRLAGQHSTVTIKQIADIRGSLRENPGPHAFIMELRDSRDIADVAAYIETLCVPPDNGRYAMADAQARLAEGRQLFASDCASCHRDNGQGDRAKGHAMLAGQHYRYLVRRMEDIRDGFRQGADPEMIKALRKYKHDKLQNIAAHLAALETPGIACEAVRAGR